MPLIAMPGIGELILIFGVVLLLFGGKKLPQLGGAVGEGIKNFKKGIKDDDEEAKKLAASGGAPNPSQQQQQQQPQQPQPGSDPNKPTQPS